MGVAREARGAARDRVNRGPTVTVLGPLYGPRIGTLPVRRLGPHHVLVYGLRRGQLDRQGPRGGRGVLEPRRHVAVEGVVGGGARRSAYIRLRLVDSGAV